MTNEKIICAIKVCSI